MAAAERVSKFYDDATLLTSAPTNLTNNTTNKLISEIMKLKSWLQKHQNEVLQDSIKTKLLQCIEMYYRKVFHRHESLVDPVTDLLGCYLQLPEGKLLSSKDKRKVLQWINSLSSLGSGDSLPKGSSSNSSPARVVSSTWIVQSVDYNNNKNISTLTLLNAENDELWKEDVAVEVDLVDKIAELMDTCDNIIVEVDNSTDRVIGIISSTTNK